jgi:hypothetical protein
LRLSDVQLALVRDVARQISPSARSAFLQEGDGSVHRVAVAVAREVLASTGSTPWSGNGNDPDR